MKRPFRVLEEIKETYARLTIKKNHEPFTFLPAIYRDKDNWPTIWPAEHVLLIKRLFR